MTCVHTDHFRSQEGTLQTLLATVASSPLLMTEVGWADAWYTMGRSLKEPHTPWFENIVSSMRELWYPTCTGVQITRSKGLALKPTRCKLFSRHLATCWWRTSAKYGNVSL